MGQADYWQEGDWNAACSMCGRKRKASQLVKNWQGLWRCPQHNDIRHPQDFVRAVPDNMTVPWAQPLPGTTGWSIACGLATGTADALVLTPTMTVIGPYPGQVFQFTAAATNTGPATVTLLGVTAAIELDGVALVAGDITVALVYLLTYEDAIFKLDS